MSIDAVKWVFDSCPLPGSSRRLMLVALAERADARGVCYPGIRDLAKRTKLSGRQVKCIVHELQKAGELRILTGGKGPPGPKDTNKYIIVMGRGQDAIRKLVAELEREAGGKGEAGNTHKGEAQRSKGEAECCGRVKPSAPKGEAGNTRTIREPALGTINRTISAGACVELSRAHEGRRGGTAALDSVFKSTGRADAVGRNGSAVQGEIIRLMGDRGCDPSFRGMVAKLGDVKIIREIAAEYDRDKDRIKNAGGWWRDQLRRRGVLPPDR